MRIIGRKVLFFLIIFLGMQTANCFCLFAESQDDNSQLIKSKHFNIYYYPGVDIEVVNAKVVLTFYDRIIERSLKPVKEGTTETKLARKIDLILYKAEKILDMYPRKMDLKIKIYKNQRQLDEAYYQVFRRPNAIGRISYYVHKYETIYTTQSAIREGVLAHEMAHAVCDHYFLIRPSEKVSELLAQYVEMHLED